MTVETRRPFTVHVDTLNPHTSCLVEDGRTDTRWRHYRTFHVEAPDAETAQRQARGMMASERAARERSR